MSRQPWYRWFPSDYLGKTVHLSIEEDCLYRRLLDIQWRDGSLPSDPERIAKLARFDFETFQEAWKEVSVFFILRGGKLVNQKLSSERRGVNRKIAQKRSAGKASAINRFRTPVQHPFNDPDPDPDPEEEKDSKTLSPKPPFSSKKPKAKHAYPDAFEALWITRPARAGGDDKRRALQAWNARISEQHSQESIQAGVDRYRAYCEKTGKIGTEYVKQMATFLGPSDPPHFTQDWAAPPNGGSNGNNGAPKTYEDYDRNIKAQIAACSADDSEADGEWLDVGESAEVLGEDGRPIRSAVVQRLRPRAK